LIIVEITLDKSRLIRSLSVHGHAGYAKKGEDIVCAAVSVLTRTFAALLEGRNGITLSGGAPLRGEMNLWVECRREGEAFLSPVQEFLTEGLMSVAREYPQNLTVKENLEVKEVYV
jgi:uncharacterized protein YsxB (DUF464 family)